MGELLLVLIIVGVVCGLLSATFYRRVYKDRDTRSKMYEMSRKAALLIVLIFGIFFGCFCFPVYNFTHEVSNGIRWTVVVTTAVAYYDIGIPMRRIFCGEEMASWKSTLAVLGLNSITLAIGMGCRYLLEFGEVSNTYNFTIPNLAFHFFVVNAICLFSWAFTKPLDTDEDQY